MLHRLAAIKLVRELEQEESSLNFRGIADISKDVERLKQEIIEISCQNGILITESSFLSILHSNSEQS